MTPRIPPPSSLPSAPAETFRSAMLPRNPWTLALALMLSGCSRGAASSPRIVSNDSVGPVPSAIVPSAANESQGGGPSAPAGVARPTDAIAAAVPRIDAALKTRLREVYRLGASRGQRPDVFAKIGDSITESASFLQDIGHGWFDLGAHADLQPTIDYFHQRRVDADSNDSFAHASQSAVAGWTSAEALAHEGTVPVARELDAIRPAFAMIMYGSNDIDRSSPDALGANLTRIVDECLRRGVIPILSTIPDRRDTPSAAGKVPAFNRSIAGVARARSIPLMDLNAALAPLPARGLDADGIHPNAWVHEGSPQTAHFNPEALRFGYNVRNLLALRTLAKLRAVVALDGAPDQ